MLAAVAVAAAVVVEPARPVGLVVVVALELALVWELNVLSLFWAKAVKPPLLLAVVEMKGMGHSPSLCGLMWMWVNLDHRDCELPDASSAHACPCTHDYILRRQKASLQCVFSYELYIFPYAGTPCHMFGTCN